jgi:hypothetical protein
MRFRNTKPFISKVLTGELIGLEPVDDGHWKLWFFGHPLGILDERKGAVRRLDKIPEPVPEERVNACGSEEN